MGILKFIKKRIRAYFYLKKLGILSDTYIKQIKSGDKTIKIEQKQLLNFFLNYTKNIHNIITIS